MDLVKKFLKMAILILDSLSMIFFKDMVSWKILLKKIGLMDCFKGVILLIWYSIIIKMAKKIMIKSSKVFIKKEAIGLIIKSH